MKREIEEQIIYSSKYNLYGKWILDDKECYLRFLYDGEFVQIPFRAVFTKKTMPWLLDAAVIKLEDRVEYMIMDKKYEVKGGTVWSE